MWSMKCSPASVEPHTESPRTTTTTSAMLSTRVQLVSAGKGLGAIRGPSSYPKGQTMAGRRCTQRGCPIILTDGNTRCIQHRAEASQARGTTDQRGYGTAHKAERARWATILTRQPMPCARCRQPITKDDEWHLDHDDDRSRYRGPSHAKCNTSAGGRRSAEFRRG